MEVNITRFRAELFELVNRALRGEPVIIPHKGARVRLSPDASSGRFSRVTPLHVVNPRQIYSIRPGKR